MGVKIITMSCTDESIVFESGSVEGVQDSMVPCLHKRGSHDQSPSIRLAGC